MKHKLLLLLTLFSIAFLLVLAGCAQTSRNNESIIEPELEVEETPLFTDEDTANAKLDVASLTQEIEGEEGAIRQIEQDIASDVVIEESGENELEVQKTLSGASGRACYIRYKPNANKPYKIYDHNQITNSKILIYSSKNEIQSTSCNLDGDIFAFAEHDGEDFELYLLTYSGISQLTDNSTDDLEVSMDVNGTRLAWEGSNKGKRAIYWRDIGFPSANVLISDRDQIDPKLTSNGSIISLVRLPRTGKYRIYNYDISSNNYTHIYASRNKLANPSSSNSESFIGWKEQEPDGGEVARVMDTDGNIHNVLKNSDGIDNPMLTCNGQGMSYAVKSEGNWAIYNRYWQQGKEVRLRGRAGNDFLGGSWAMRCLAGLQEGELTVEDSIDPDRSNYYSDYYIDYYDLKDLENTLSSQAVGDPITLILQGTFSPQLTLYNKDQRHLNGGGEIKSSEGVLSFTVESGITYLVGVSSRDTSQIGLYTLSTNSGLLEPSNFGKLPPIVDSKEGELTTDDLKDPDTTYDSTYPYYIDYYDLTDLGTQVVGDKVVFTLESSFHSNLIIYNKDNRQFSGGGTITSSDLGLLSFTIESGVNYLIGVSSDYGYTTGSYTLSTSLGSLSPSDFGEFPPMSDSEEGELTTDDLIDFDTTYDPYYPYYIDYYDLTDLDSNLGTQAVGDEIVLTLESSFHSSLIIYNKDNRQLTGGGTIVYSDLGWLSFTIESGVDYLIGVSSYYEGDTGSYTLSTSLGLLEPSDFGQPSDSKGGELTAGDLINPDASDYGAGLPYIDYYDLTNLGDNLGTQAVGDEVMLTLKNHFVYDAVLFLYNKNSRQLTGGGTIISSELDLLNFTIESGIDYLIGVSSDYGENIGSYTLSTSLGLLAPSDFGQPSDSKEGELTTDDLINPDATYDFYYIDYYDLTDLDVQTIGDEVVLALKGHFDYGSGELFLYDKDNRQLTGGGIIVSPSSGLLSFTIESGIDYLIGVSSYYEAAIGSYTLSTSLGLLAPSNFGQPSDIETGELTTDDLIDFDTTYDLTYPYYIDYYDLTDLDINLSTQAVGDEVALTLKSSLSYSKLILYNKDNRQLSGGGTIISSDSGLLSFTIESGIDYLIGVSSYYEGDTGSYTLSTSLGSLSPSDFGQYTIADLKRGRLTTEDLTNPDTTYDNDYPYYIDYYDLTALGNNTSTQSVGDEVVLILEEKFEFNYNNGTILLYDKDKRDLSGGGELSSSSVGLLGFTLESGINYLVGISSEYENNTGRYKISTSFGLLEPSSFGK